MRFILVLLLICSGQLHAALASGIVWEVRSTATAANANGGGFKTGASGTDWSQQDAAQYNLTGGTSAGAGAIILHASASTDMVGNIAHVISGTNTTAGWYEITAVSAGASITVDRNVTTGVGASIVLNIGGAISLGSNTANQTDASWAAAIVPGNTIWIKSANTLAAALTFTDCTNALPCATTGYQTTRGDNPTGSNRPTINSAAQSNNGGAYNTISNLIFTGTAATMWSSDGRNVWYNNKFTNTSATASRTPLNAGGDLVANNEFISYNGFGFTTAGEVAFIGNYVHDSVTCIRATATAVPVNISRNIFAGCLTAGINISGANTSIVVINANTIYGSENQTGTTGVLLAAGASNTRLTNNIIYGWTTGVSAAASTTNWSNWNDFNNNGTARTNWTAGVNDISTSPAFLSVAQVAGSAGSVSGSVITDSGANFGNVTNNSDFVCIVSGTGITTAPGCLLITAHTTTTITTSPAPGGSGSNIVYSVRTGHNFGPGAAMANLAHPGSFPGSSTTSYLDIGAVQTQNTDPGVANVLSTATYIFQNASKTGTYVGPSTGDVKTGVTYGAASALTGTYDGSDRWTDPGIANVKLGVAYKANSTSNNRTGTKRFGHSGGGFGQ